MQTAQKDIIKLTDRAARRLNKIRSAEAESGEKMLRVGVKGGGCSGLSYTLEFDTVSDKDVLVEINGVPLIIDKRHALYLEGTVVDFKDGLDARGFTFENPRATSTCGCGSSFSV